MERPGGAATAQSTEFVSGKRIGTYVRLLDIIRSLHRRAETVVTARSPRVKEREFGSIEMV
jgi:hypothetical protein